METTSIEDLQLEPSITRVSANTIRFGQVGSMLVREYFPFIAVEDTEHNVVWGAQVAHAGSWQIEAYRKDDALNISGGLAHREFGHWMKRIKPGEGFATPKATITVTEGGLDKACQRLTSLQYRAWEQQPKLEAELPIIFNEWCTTWGNVSANMVEKIAKRIEGKCIKYLVIDAGWYDSMGTWNYDIKRLPNGLEKTTKMIRDMGMVPGIWFELECCEERSSVFSLVGHMLRLDGYIISWGGRHFWGMRNAYTVDTLLKRLLIF